MRLICRLAFGGDMNARTWADDLLKYLKMDLDGMRSSRNRVSIHDHAFISVKMDGELVAVQVGDLDSASSDFEPFVFNPTTTTINDAARDLMPLIRCIQWLET